MREKSSFISLREEQEEWEVLTIDTNIDRRFRRHLAHAEIEQIDGSDRKLNFLAMRYSFATRLAQSAVSMRVAQELMRHGDVNLTANLYTDARQLGGDDRRSVS